MRDKMAYKTSGTEELPYIVNGLLDRVSRVVKLAEEIIAQPFSAVAYEVIEASRKFGLPSTE